MQVACGDNPPALRWHSIKFVVITVVLTLQVCHGCSADPDCGISTEVLMIQFCQEAQICIARHKDQSFTATEAQVEMHRIVTKCLHSGALMQGAGVTLSAIFDCAALTIYELWTVQQCQHQQACLTVARSCGCTQ